MKNGYGCSKDTDCCGGKTRCVDSICLNSKQYRNYLLLNGPNMGNDNNAFTNDETLFEDEFSAREIYKSHSFDITYVNI